MIFWIYKKGKGHLSSNKDSQEFKDLHDSKEYYEAKLGLKNKIPGKIVIWIHSLWEHDLMKEYAFELSFFIKQSFFACSNWNAMKNVLKKL